MIEDRTEILLRNIHPTWLDDGVPTSMAFRPSPKDDKMLSVDQQSKTSPKASFELYTSVRLLKSAGVYGLAVSECSAQELACLEDPISESAEEVENKAHALIDFSSHGTRKREKIAKKLKANAIVRGKLHP